MCIRFNKVDGFTRIYDGARHLVLFAPEKYDAIYNWIRYIISLKSDITFIFFLLLRKNQSWFLWFFTYRKKIDFT